MRPDNPSALRFYLSIIQRHWRPMLIAFVVPIAIALALTLSAKKQYQGTALVVINRQSLADQLNGTPDPSASSSDFLNIITTYAEAAHSTQVADRVAAAVPGAGLTPAQVLNNSTVTAQQDADVVDIAVRNPDPALALRLAGAFARQFVAYEQGLGVSAINLALRQVDAQLAQARSSHHRSLVVSLSQRDNQLRTLRTLQTASDYVVSPGNTASLVSPRKGLDIGLGLLGGILLAALLAAVLEALDPGVPTSDELEAALAAPSGSPRAVAR
jgi:capsular polysaccharide biosynthesis protein